MTLIVGLIANVMVVWVGGADPAVAEVSNIAAWGSDDYGQTDVPGGTDFVQVAAGVYYGLALRSDGSIAGWGFTPGGVENPPLGNGFVAIAAGGGHALALRSDRSIVGWGETVDGQGTPPPGNDFVGIAAGSLHSLAVKVDGSIVGWGFEDHGQATPPPGNDFVAVAAGAYHSLALKSDGSIVGWGWNHVGQISVPVGNDFTAIAAAENQSVALRSNGSIVAWGDISPAPVGNQFTAVATGGHAYGLALKADGSIVAWGSGVLPGSLDPPLGNGFVAIAAGRDHALALTDGVLTQPRLVSAFPGDRSAQVAWLAPTSDAGSKITSYEVVSTPPSAGCTTAGELTCTVRGLSVGTPYTFTVRAVNDIGPGPWSAPSAPVTPYADPFGEFTPLAPARILDTRTGLGRGGVVGPLAENSPVEVQITGRGGVTAIGVSAVVMNVTVTRPTTRSYLTVWPAGAERPGSSNLNYTSGQTIPNHVTVAVGDAGRVNVVNRFGTAHVIFDVVGFYADHSGPAGSRYHPIDPSRLFDTRTRDTSGVPAVPVGPGGTLAFDVLGVGGVPTSGVTAVVMNVTAARATEWSYLTVFPGDLSRPPLASNLNYRPGQAVPNLVTVRVPASGVVKFYNEFGSVHVIADIVGFFDEDRSSQSGRFVALEPYRIYDSRDLDEPWGPDEAWLVGDFPGFAGLRLGEAEAVVLNVTVARPTAWSYLTVFPAHLCFVPNVSNLNFVADQTVPNQVVTRLGTSGGCAQPDEIETIAVYNYDGSTHVIVDVFGFFTAPSTTVIG